MQNTVQNNHIVSIHYTLTDDQEQVIDTSLEREPLNYLHGHGNIVAGLEKELDGREVGDQFEVVIPPADGYGEYNDELVATLPIEHFEQIDDLQVGMQLQASGPEGDAVQVLTITNIEDGHVTVDGNHPLAGKTLYFDIRIESVREASPVEIEHGHVH